VRGDGGESLWRRRREEGFEVCAGFELWDFGEGAVGIYRRERTGVIGGAGWGPDR
jgi:hypothetical protein